MPSATESATCSLEMMPRTSAAVGTLVPATTTAVASPHSLDHLEADIVLVGDHEVALRDLAKGNAGIGGFEATPEPDVDARHALDAIIADDDAVLERTLVLGLVQERIEIGHAASSRHCRRCVGSPNYPRSR